MILNRKLKPGTELPSTRSLAGDLSIGRNTVIAAYDQLLTEGYLLNRSNARPVVVDLPPGPAAHELVEPVEFLSRLSARGLAMLEQPFFVGQTGRTAFHPGMPDAEEFPFVQWSRLLAQRAAGGRKSLFGTYDVLGYPRLREGIANYLNVARGMRCNPEQVVITTGLRAPSICSLACSSTRATRCGWRNQVTLARRPHSRSLPQPCFLCMSRLTDGSSRSARSPPQKSSI